MINNIKMAIMFLALGIGLSIADPSKPAMAIEFSTDGFKQYISKKIVPWMFEDCGKFSDDGMTYNKLTLHNTEY